MVDLDHVAGRIFKKCLSRRGPGDLPGIANLHPTTPQLTNHGIDVVNLEGPVLALGRGPLIVINLDEMYLRSRLTLKPRPREAEIGAFKGLHSKHLCVEGLDLSHAWHIDGNVMYGTYVHADSSWLLDQVSQHSKTQVMTTTLDWYGCTTFRMKTAGLSIFLDAYIDRVEGAQGTGLTADDIEDCDWVVIGHSHFDHLWGAERIAANTGAKLICSYESVRVMEQAGVPLDQMICVAGGETIELGNGVTVSVYPSQHSCVWTQSNREMDQSGHVCIGDLGVTWQEQQEAFKALMEHLQTGVSSETSEHLKDSLPGHSNRGDGGALVFVFETPDGSVLFQDTSGHWSGVMRGLQPDVAIIGAAGRGNIDGEPIQGSLAHFIARQADLLRPKTVVLSHHDNWLPGLSIPTEMDPIRDELERVVPNTRLLEMGYLEGTEILPVQR